MLDPSNYVLAIDYLNAHRHKHFPFKATLDYADVRYLIQCECGARGYIPCQIAPTRNNASLIHWIYEPEGVF